MTAAQKFKIKVNGLLIQHIIEIGCCQPKYFIWFVGCNT